MPSALAVCSACQKQTPTHLPRCGYCGSENTSWSEAAAAIAKGSKAHGYTKQTDLFDVEEALKQIPEQKKLERFNLMGDLLTEMRGRKRKADADLEGVGLLSRSCLKRTSALSKYSVVLISMPGKATSKVPCTPVAAAAAPSTPAPAAVAPSTPPVPNVPPESPEKAGSESGSEWDLNNPDHCCEVLEHRFPQADVEKRGFSLEQFEKICSFYVDSLKKKTPKAPLSDWFLKDLDDICSTKKKRMDWLLCWGKHRQRQFLQKPAKKHGS